MDGRSPCPLVGARPIQAAASASSPATTLSVHAHPSIFTIPVVPSKIGDSIWIHLTDRDHRNLGYIVSPRTIVR